MEVMPQSLALRDFPLPKSCVQMEYGAREAPQPQKGVALVFAYPMITAKPDAISHARYGALIEDALAIWSALVRKMAFFCSGYESKDIHPGGKMLAFENVSDAMAFCTRVQVELMHADWPEELLEFEAYREQYYVEDESGDTDEEFFQYSEYSGDGDDDGDDLLSPTVPTDALSKRKSARSKRRQSQSPRLFAHVKSAAEFRSASMESDVSSSGRSLSASSRRSSFGDDAPIDRDGAKADSVRSEQTIQRIGKKAAKTLRGESFEGAVLINRGMPVKMGISWGYPESIKPQSTTGRYVTGTIRT